MVLSSRSPIHRTLSVKCALFDFRVSPWDRQGPSMTDFHSIVLRGVVSVFCVNGLVLPGIELASSGPRVQRLRLKTTAL